MNNAPGERSHETADLPRGSWLGSEVHRSWARHEASRLIEFFRHSLVDGWLRELDDDGEPVGAPGEPPRQDVLNVARAVHTYALAAMLGVPGGDRLVSTGLEVLWERHRDPVAGGYFAAVGPDGPADATKSAYNHAFVLLAASSALTAGYPARELFDDALATIDAHFWSESEGASSEAYDGQWREIEAYRGANSNMHLTESLLAAADATGRTDLAERAVRIATKLIDGHARANGWLLPEHYTPSWEPVLDYNRDRMDDRFRPYGATVGHSVEWSRLLLAAGLATGRVDEPWCLPASRALFARAMDVGWDERVGGLAYTVDWNGGPANTDHYWWPVAEAIGTSSYLLRLTGDHTYEAWYRRFWEHASEVLIDHERGGWYPVFDADNRKKSRPWGGKPDVYHAFQACLLPLLPLAPSLAGAIYAASGGVQA
jgi:mannose/cellobiose epimerase-like protein (N-acyl-D-glucosamine 2-epimerase family)